MMKRWIMKNETLFMWITLVLITIGFFFRFLTSMGGWEDRFLIAATVVAIWPVVIKAWQALMVKTFAIELLVTVAVIGALIIGEYVESSVVLFLFLFGSYLEKRTLEKTRSSIKELTDLAPQEAIRLDQKGDRETIPVEEVDEGDRLVILPGARVPVDGKVVDGEASINEAAVTGESVPVSKAEGDKVYAGTVADTGYMEMVAEKVGADTAFSKIIELVEEAQDSKSKTEKFLDRFSQWYTPGVALLSVLVYLIMRDVHLAITFLVIACPGALVIGAPVSNVAGIGNGAKNGTLIKGGDIMENLAKVDTLVFDKTGTLTKGKPEVTDVKLWHNELTEERLLSLVGKAETVSEHHLGKTIVQYVDQEEIDYAGLEIETSEAWKGRGLTATVDGHDIVAGNRKLMEEADITIDSAQEDYAVDKEKLGNTAIFVAVDGQLAALISIADKVREQAKEALQAMRNDGIERIIMLTGDNRHTAEAVANELGIDEFYAELLPEEKVEYVKQFKEEGATISMAGDGVNDAPAIATADVGLAMGDGGTDVSMETADVVLMADKLHQYAHAYALSNATMNNMRQNIAIALITVAILLSGVLFGMVNLSIGMLVHEGSVLLVILNAMRLIRFKPRIA